MYALIMLAGAYGLLQSTSLASSFDEHFKPAIAGAALMVLLAMLLRMMWRDALPVTAAEIGAPARALE
jgi:hypothetical protein